MKSGRREKNDHMIAGLFKGNAEAAQADEDAGHLYQAYLEYRAVARDFKGLRDVTEFEKKAAELKESKAVKQALKQEAGMESEQRTRGAELFRLRAVLRDRRVNAALADGENAPQETAGRMAPMAGGAERPSQSLERTGPGDEGDGRQFALSDLKRALADLKKRSEAKESSPQRAIARRVLNQFLIGSYELSTTLLRSKRYDLAAANLAIDSELMPDNWRVHYNLACAYAMAGEKKKSIEALKKAVGAGFSNAAELEANKDLDPLRDERGFKDIVEQLKTKARIGKG